MLNLAEAQMSTMLLRAAVNQRPRRDHLGVEPRGWRQHTEEHMQCRSDQSIIGAVVKRQGEVSAGSAEAAVVMRLFSQVRVARRWT